jgi:hypothetical protein
LASALLKSNHSTILWEVSELESVADELLVQQLVQLSSQLTPATHCKLLPLDSEVGIVGSSNALLWLSGCSGTAQFVPQSQFDPATWYSPDHYEHYQLSDWCSEFDRVLVIANVATDRPLPQIPKACGIVATRWMTASGRPLTNWSHLIPIAEVGWDQSAILVRSDHAVVHFVPALQAEDQSRALGSTAKNDCGLPTAACVIEQLQQHIAAIDGRTA